MKKAAFVAFAFAFTIAVPAFAQNYMSSKVNNFSSFASTLHHASVGEDGLRICANQPK